MTVGWIICESDTTEKHTIPEWPPSGYKDIEMVSSEYVTVTRIQFKFHPNVLTIYDTCKESAWSLCNYMEMYKVYYNI